MPMDFIVDIYFIPVFKMQLELYWCPDNCARGKSAPPQLGLVFGYSVGLGLGAIFLGGSCPRTNFNNYNSFITKVISVSYS